MSSTDPLFSGIALDDLKNVESALNRFPNGKDLVALATRSGLWTEESHNQEWKRPKFNTKIGDMLPATLSNEFALWTSEYGRLCEVLGHLNAHKDSLKLNSKSTRAAARSRIRREGRIESAVVVVEGSKPKAAEKPKSAGEINDLAEEDSGVLDSDKSLNVVEMLISIVGATKEGTQAYLSTLSREIAFREAAARMRFA